MYRPSPGRRRGGFTLIELLVVIAILGILGAVAIPRIQGARTKALWQEAHINLAAIASFEMDHRLAQGSFVATPPNPATVPSRCRTGQTRWDGERVEPPASEGWRDDPAWAAIGFAPIGAPCFQYEVVVEGDGFRVYARGGGPVGRVGFVLDAEDFEVRRIP